MNDVPDETRVADYSFRKEHLSAGSRLPGISAFMRIRNGAEFLEATIRSHIGKVDEVVAVYNQCTDATAAVLAKLQGQYGTGKLRVFHYLPRVYPPGSPGHAQEPADSPASFVNMSNFALSRTRFSVAMKLDDDHLAMPERLGALTRRIVDADYTLDHVLCFSGINLARDESGTCGVLAADPLAGAGDHFFFEVGPDTCFIHDRRFEDFSYGGRKRVFADLTYWHLKYLNADFGFGNREVACDGNPRFARKRDAFLSARRVIPLADLVAGAPAELPLPGWLLPKKTRLTRDRWRKLRAAPPAQAELASVCGTAGAS
ncbi:hypothetical protein BH10PSE12_BH10PSE12_24600 [soil metagenome]